MTAQIHEKLILDGHEVSMSFCPPLPENDSRIIELNDEEVSKNNENVDERIFSTACWREYLGTWEIKDNKFYLVNLVGRFKIVDNSPILADWFTGTLKIPKGKILHYVHMEFESVYEKEGHINISNGIVTGYKAIDNRSEGMK